MNHVHTSGVLKCGHLPSQVGAHFNTVVCGNKCVRSIDHPACACHMTSEWPEGMISTIPSSTLRTLLVWGEAEGDRRTVSSLL
jgi:hypothetical protein